MVLHIHRDRSLFLLLIFATEKFQVYKTPVLPKNINWLMSFVVLGGYLCFIVNSFLKYNEVWLMKEYGWESSWTRIYKIKQGTVPWNFHYCKPLIFSKNGKKVMLKEGHEGGANLVWYDIK